MVEKRNCSFCGQAIEPGTGKMFIKKDGTVFNFCSNKCKKNNIGLGRVSRRTRWTTRYGELKASTLQREKGPEEEAEPQEKPVEKPKAKKAPAKKETAAEKPKKAAPKKEAKK